MNRFLSIRWILLGLGLFAVIGLTIMNVYSLYMLHETTVNATRDSQRNKVVEFISTVSQRFRPAVTAIWPMNIEQIHESLRNNHIPPQSLLEHMGKVAADSLFSEVYFAASDFQSCDISPEMHRYNAQTGALQRVSEPPQIVCDGIGLARTRVKMLINEYRWNTKTIFDSHRTMNVVLINHRGHDIVGYLSFVIDQNYLANHFMKQELADIVGSHEDGGMTVWVYDWLKGELILKNDSDVTYEIGKVSLTQRFPDMLDNWVVRVAVDETPVITESRASMIRNLAALMVAFLLLMVSLVFIFIIGQRERALSLRQAGFLANVTHELKTPLAVMQAAGENLSDGRVKDGERLKTYGQHIYDEAVRLRKMIDKLLNVAKSDAGQNILALAPASVEHLLNEYLTTNASYLQHAGFTPEVSIENNLPLVMMDPDSFDTIIGNLIENAIKYSQTEKFLAIRAYKKHHQVVIEVEDHGKGIPVSAQKHVFDKFFRVEDTLTAKTKGHGLGLAIVKNLTELSGGRISLKSEYGKGSKFLLHFPILVPGDGRLTSKPAHIKKEHISEENVAYAD